MTSSGKSIFALDDEIKMLNHKNNNLPHKGNPGYVIAFTKYYVDTIGYPDETLIGGGDTLTCSIALKTKLFGGRHRKQFEYLYDKYAPNMKNIKTKLTMIKWEY